MNSNYREYFLSRVCYTGVIQYNLISYILYCMWTIVNIEVYFGDISYYSDDFILVTKTN